MKRTPYTVAEDLGFALEDHSSRYLSGRGRRGAGHVAKAARHRGRGARAAAAARARRPGEAAAGVPGRRGAASSRDRRKTNTWAIAALPERSSRRPRTLPTALMMCGVAVATLTCAARRRLMADVAASNARSSRLLVAGVSTWET